jgi:DNA-binding LacI/PurR family transcriptional regulator
VSEMAKLSGVSRKTYYNALNQKNLYHETYQKIIRALRRNNPENSGA